MLAVPVVTVTETPPSPMPATQYWSSKINASVVDYLISLTVMLLCSAGSTQPLIFCSSFCFLLSSSSWTSPLVNLDALPHFFLFISTCAHNLFLGPALPIYPNLFLDTCLPPHTCCSCPSSRIFSHKLGCPKSLLTTIDYHSSLPLRHTSAKDEGYKKPWERPNEKWMPVTKPLCCHIITPAQHQMVLTEHTYPFARNTLPIPAHNYLKIVTAWARSNTTTWLSSSTWWHRSLFSS